MAVSLPILLINILLVCMFAACVQAQNQALPNCSTTCGGVNIPYPFGIGVGCYKAEAYEITCNNTNNSTGPFLKVIGHEVVDISLDHQLSIKGLSTIKCYEDDSGPYLDLRGTPFTLSDTKNTLSGLGCDILAYITDSVTLKYMTGCVSLCRPGNIDLFNGSCFGNGCCEISIPKGLKAINLSVNSFHTQPWGSLERCIYMTLQDGGLINSNWRLHSNFSLISDITIEMMVNAMNTSKGVVLDWVIGEETCEKARGSPSFACRAADSECVDSTNGPGYYCNCSRGYKGNPYLSDGCQDIDECSGLHKCLEGNRCVNLKGSYYCRCPSGKVGDGRRDGIGCFRSQELTHYATAVIPIGIGIGIGLLIVLAVGFWLYKKLKKRKQMKLKQRFFKRNGGLLLEQQISSSEGNIEKTKVFVTEDLQKATDNFNESRILGTGGSGTVYKGMLSDGRIVAIKKSKVVDESQIGQFINELVILSHINHRNVVKLLGCCLETEVPLLAYEFISNGTLSYHLHDEDHKSSISWENRLRIAIEIARALAYLHSSVSTPIFHRDIKSNNILLDENFRAKVSDFGISRSVPYEKTHLTTLVQGTFGYLDPEYFHSSQFTDKSDVYSFGVVLVELLTGHKPISFSRSEEQQNLVMHFVSSIKENRVFEILESRVLKEGDKEELLVVAKLAKRCLKIVGKKRPTMKEVANKLEGLRNFPEQECVPQICQDTKYLKYDSLSCSISGPESEDSSMICHGGQ